jgi:hypothetical protein
LSVWYNRERTSVQQLLPEDSQRVMPTDLSGRSNDCGRIDPALLCRQVIVATRTKKPSEVYSMTLCNRCLAEGERVKHRLHGYSVVRMIPTHEKSLPSDPKAQWHRLPILTLLVPVMVAMAKPFGPDA